MRRFTSALLSIPALLAVAQGAQAAGLQVTPIMVDLPAGSAASTITLSNTGTEDLNAQIRVYKWVQVNGTDQLLPTQDVVASPPATKIAGNGSNVIRIVRISKTPVATEETYRLKVDEVPKLGHTGQAAVTFAISYSLPVFFSPASAPPELAWTAKVSKGQLQLEAINSGGHHAKLTDLKIVSGAKATMIAPGLAGYVLSRSKRDWSLKSAAKLARAGDTLKIVANSEAGPVEDIVHVEAAN